MTILDDFHRHLSTRKTCSTVFAMHMKMNGLDPHWHTPAPGTDHHPTSPCQGASPPAADFPPLPSPHLQVYTVSLNTHSFLRFHQHQIKFNAKQTPQHPNTNHIQSHLKTPKDIQFRSRSVRLWQHACPKLENQYIWMGLQALRRVPLDGSPPRCHDSPMLGKLKAT